MSERATRIVPRDRALYGEPDMSAESARDVLRDVVADSLDVSLMDDACDAHRASDRRAARLQIARDVLAEIAAHPVELLALLAEPQVCEMCGGHGEAQWLASCSECGGLGLDPLRNDRACSRCGGSCEVLVIRDDVPCPSCHGTRKVAVDVLDLLGYEQVGWESVREVCNHADSLLSLAAHRGVDDEWKMEAIALSLRFRGLAKQLQSPIYMAIP